MPLHVRTVLQKRVLLRVPEVSFKGRQSPGVYQKITRPAEVRLQADGFSSDRALRDKITRKYLMKK